MPLVPPDHARAAFLIRPDHLAQILRVEVLRECRGPHYVTEQHGELTALGLGRCTARFLRDLSLVSSVLVPLHLLGRLGFILCALARYGNRRGKWAPTLAAEGKSGRVRKPTLGTGRTQRSPTLPTKTHLCGILKPTALTTHAASLLLWL